MGIGWRGNHRWMGLVMLLFIGAGRVEGYTISFAATESYRCLAGCATTCLKMKIDGVDAKDKDDNLLVSCGLGYTSTPGVPDYCYMACNSVVSRVLYISASTSFWGDGVSNFFPQSRYNSSCDGMQLRRCSTCLQLSVYCSRNQYRNCAAPSASQSCQTCPVGSRRDSILYPQYATGVFVCMCTAGYYSTANTADQSDLQDSIDNVASKSYPPSSYYSTAGVAPCGPCSAGKYAPGDYYPSCLEGPTRRTLGSPFVLIARVHSARTDSL